MIMDVKELRIGNLLELNGKNVFVSSILKPGLNSDAHNLTLEEKQNPEFGNSLWSNVDKVNPVPITEEWLLKAGFEETEQSKFYRLNEDYYSFYLIDGFVYYDGGGPDNPIGMHIKYVHKLQNIVFELTGEELKIS